ncbi:hypothetical protein ACWHA3_21095 [Streptomyces cyaneofuscatus]
MATGTTESPATLYAPVSLCLGVVAVVLSFFLAVFALLAGALAVTFGVLGLVSRVPVNRTQCYIGLAAGAVGVLLPLFFLFAYTGGL